MREGGGREGQRDKNRETEKKARQRELGREGNRQKEIQRIGWRGEERQAEERERERFHI